MAKSKLTPQTPGEHLPEEVTQAPEAAAPEAEQPTTTETAPAAQEVPAVVETAPASGELPDQSEIDPSAIERPVLSKQGWVLPHKAG